MEKLKTLSSIPAVSGYENKIIEFLKREFINLNYEIKRDNLGSIIFTKKPLGIENPKKIVVDAHIDEVGFLITQISEKGTATIERVGGLDCKLLQNQTLMIWNKDFTKYFLGILTFPNQSQQNLNLETAILDLGFKDKKSLLDNNIDIGCAVTFVNHFFENNDSVIAKALDNRVGTYLLIKAAEYFDKKDLKYELTFVFSTQEEVGLRGSRTAVYNENPDLVIIVDVSPANDLNGEAEPYGVLGNGTMLRHKDAYTLYRKDIVLFLKKLFIENDIKYQDYFSMGGTNAGIIQLIKSGIFVLPIGLVARNIHTEAAIINKDDLLLTEKALKILLEKINENINQNKTIFS